MDSQALENNKEAALRMVSRLIKDWQGRRETASIGMGSIWPWKAAAHEKAYWICDRAVQNLYAVASELKGQRPT